MTGLFKQIAEPLVVALMVLATASSTYAAPRTPGDAAEVLEKLPLQARDAAARELYGLRPALANAPTEAVDAASQRLLQALGADVTPDGAFGDSSKAAYQTLADQHGDTSVETDPIERLIAIARIHWSTTPFRVDLY